MNTIQIIVLAWLGVLAVAGRPSVALWAVCANFAATLAAAGMMDIDVLSRNGATLAMMLIDAMTAAYLVRLPGLSRIVAATMAVSSAIHVAALVFGVTTSTTFAIVYVVNIAQLGALTIGSFNSGGGGFRFRSFLAGRGLASSPRDAGLSAQGMAGDIARRGR